MRGVRGAAVLAAAALLTSCAGTVAGTAQPASVARPPASTQPQGPDPCSLLTPADANKLELAPEPEFTAGDKDQLLPPFCQWEPADPDSDHDPVGVGLSEDLAIEEYFASREPAEILELGGLQWGRYESTFGDTICNLAVKLDDFAFVVIAGGHLDGEEKACELPKAAAPLVASQLSG
ncbi:DUF3558 family protein [Amycolatopsis cihanbeyliensis]|uniref:DUF3558 family protein n=1 Tax=Amycolatopsis cihanbeyliensis TaxID=1128664 RepID=UPI001153E496|nr:DUF3558 family protein [Amycolatopsis cihanbeyliensis]